MSVHHIKINTETGKINGAISTAVFIEEQSHMENFVFTSLSRRSHILLTTSLFISLNQFYFFTWNQATPFCEQRGVARRPKQRVFLFACVASPRCSPAQNNTAVFFLFFFLAVFDIVVSPLYIRHSYSSHTIFYCFRHNAEKKKKKKYLTTSRTSLAAA